MCIDSPLFLIDNSQTDHLSMYLPFLSIFSTFNNTLAFIYPLFTLSTCAEINVNGHFWNLNQVRSSLHNRSRGIESQWYQRTRSTPFEDLHLLSGLSVDSQNVEFYSKCSRKSLQNQRQVNIPLSRKFWLSLRKDTSFWPLFVFVLGAKIESYIVCFRGEQ